MTGDEFKAARIAAGLSYRQAAQKLGVTLRAVQLWEMKGAEPVPSRAEAITTESAESGRVAYIIGRIAYQVEQATGRSLSQAVRKKAATGAGLAELLAAYHASGVERERVTELMAQLPASITTAPADSVSFELGYYHEKAGVA